MTRYRDQQKLLDAAGATGSGRSWEPKSPLISLQIIGTFVATIQLQVSEDGSNWVTINTYTSTGSYSLETAAKYIRCNVSAYTSGNVTVLATEKSK